MKNVDLSRMHRNRRVKHLLFFVSSCDYFVRNFPVKTDELQNSVRNVGYLNKLYIKYIEKGQMV